MSAAAVVGGAPDLDHPAVVAVVERRTACDAAEAVRCSGTVIAPWVVLTAAHCLDGRRADELEVVIGADLRGPAGAAHAVVAAAIHPAYVAGAVTEGRDLALLLTDGPLAVTPLAVATAVPPEAVAGATVRLIALGAPADRQDGGLRLAADATIESITATDLVTRGGGIPCGADSGGAVVVATADGERLLAAIKASGPGCTDPGRSTVVPGEVTAWIEPFVAAAATAPGSSRPPLAAIDACASTCATVDDCPLGMLCLPERDGSHCGYRELRTVALGEVCTTGASCVAVGAGAERTCRVAATCPADEVGCGCASSDGSPSAALALVLALVWRRRRPARARTPSPVARAVCGGVAPSAMAAVRPSR